MEQMLSSQKLKLIEDFRSEYHDEVYEYFEHGFITYRVGSTNLHITNIFVDAEHRRKGIVIEAMTEFKNSLSGYGIKTVSCMVQSDYEHKDRSIAMFKRMGMKYSHAYDGAEYYAIAL